MTFLHRRLGLLGAAVCLTAACGSSSSSNGTGGSSGTGGASTGGASTGGSATGGAATGGSATGGVASGGAATGGSGVGGAATGGAAVGGAAGGTANGGKGGGSSSAGGKGGSSYSAGGTTATGGGGGGATAPSATMNFFVSSMTSATANLNGLAGADARCQAMATAVGQGAKVWRAYLSAATPATNAADRIGPGPYFNAQGVMIAADKAALHARTGDATLFLTEEGKKVNGQWANSPTPNEHDILTGTQRDGTLATGMTCGDWTATTGMSQVGHSDGLGPNMATTGSYSYWNSVHTGQCGNTQPGGGVGRIYCFVGAP